MDSCLFSFICKSVINVPSSTYAMDIHGAGATFPALVYQTWASKYTAHKGQNVDYLAVGSGEGIKGITAK